MAWLVICIASLSEVAAITKRCRAELCAMRLSMVLGLTCWLSDFTKFSGLSIGEMPIMQSTRNKKEIAIISFATIPNSSSVYSLPNRGSRTTATAIDVTIAIMYV